MPFSLSRWPTRITLGRLLPHARGIAFKSRREGFPSGAPKAKVRVLHTVQLDVTYVMIVLNGGVPIAFAGTEEPAAYGEVISIGGLNPTVNGKLSSTIADILQTKLSIDSSRFYIKFYDVERSFFGFNGSTF
nr:macrophage migration inhibitory factor homolog [Tanacetum cinerariifolium]